VHSSSRNLAVATYIDYAVLRNSGSATSKSKSMLPACNTQRRLAAAIDSEAPTAKISGHLRIGVVDAGFLPNHLT
jgi:hypothetical protein